MCEMYRGNGTLVAGKEYVAYDVRFMHMQENSRI